MRLRLPRQGDDLDDVDTWGEFAVCDSKDDAHLQAPRLATAHLHWVTGPVDYCAPCAAMMLEVARVLGVHVKVEAIPLPTPRGGRAIALGGLP